jgi:hypothetical protein
MNLYITATCTFLIAAFATFVAAGNSQPQTTWEWATLIIGSTGAGLTAFMGYLSKTAGSAPSQDSEIKPD